MSLNAKNLAMVAGVTLAMMFALNMAASYPATRSVIRPRPMEAVA